MKPFEVLLKRGLPPAAAPSPRRRRHNDQDPLPPRAAPLRSLATFGLSLSAAMQAIFFLTGLGRGGLYLAVQLVAVLFSGTAAWGVAAGGRAGAWALGAGLAGNAVVRAVSMAAGLSRLPTWVNVWILVAYAAAGLFALLHAARPARSLAPVRGAAWALGFGWFVAAGNAMSGGRLWALLALMLGSVGFLLAAPNLGEDFGSAGPPDHDHANTRPR